MKKLHIALGLTLLALLAGCASINLGHDPSAGSRGLFLDPSGLYVEGAPPGQGV